MLPSRDGQIDPDALMEDEPDVLSTIRSRMAPVVAGLAFLTALTGMVAGGYVGGILQHLAPSRLAERPRLEVARHHDRIAAPSEPEVSDRVPPGIAALVQEHEAVRATLAWRMSGAMCQ